MLGGGHYVPGHHDAFGGAAELGFGCLGAIKLEGSGFAGGAVGGIGQVADHVHQAVALDFLGGEADGAGAVVVQAALELLAGPAELGEDGLTGLVDAGVVVDEAVGHLVANLVLGTHGADDCNPISLSSPSGGLHLLDVDRLFHDLGCGASCFSTALGGLLSSKHNVVRLH